MAKKTIKKEENLKVRTPVVTVMGHVDHGKTSFLDAVRGTRVADKEAGGITQNTRAHEVVLDNGFKITFIDTPGHEAFSKMRLRGSKVTDFVLLIVAADDGVQPQTKESIEFAKKAGVPIIVGINKIDIKGVNTLKIKTELSSFGVNIEEYGGDVLCFEISAKEKTGLKELLEGIQLLTEISELKSKDKRENTLAEAFVLESNQDKFVGNVALCILKSGELKDRVYVAEKNSVFKVRAYLDHNQKNINTVTESQPFWVTGLKSTINAGETIYFLNSEEEAKKLNQVLNDEEEIVVSEEEALDNESLFAQMLLKKEEIKQGVAQKELNIIVKASTEGTLEAVVTKLETLSDDETKVKILDAKTGDVTEDEITRAKLAKAIIVTFQLPIKSKIASIAKQEKVLVRNYEVIYELFDEIEEVIDSMGEPIEEEIDVAISKIKQVFTLTNGDIVAGGEVIKGTMLKGYRVKVMRKDKELGRGKITSLRMGKQEAKEVKKGLECGIIIDPKVLDIQEGDEVIAFRVEVY